MAHAFSYDFSAPFKQPAESALDKFRARESAEEALIAQALPVDPGERQAYVLCKSAPEVAASEVEQAGVQALEITILWGANVLHVVHLTPPRNFSVGELEGCDFLLPKDKLGSDKLPLIMVEGGYPSLVVPAGAGGEIEPSGGAKIAIADARPNAEAVAELPGAHRIALTQGSRALLRIGDFSFRVGVVTAGKKSKHGIGAGWDRTVAAYFGGAFLIQAAVMAGLAFLVPPLDLSGDDELDQERFYVMQQMLTSAAERE
ncbi:MAG TPA: hypothetical protein VGP93_15355, partial [Polyangiaceae bacterium]|nr:hypothetical protein [Polyangiaceae bacterium]